MTNRCEGVSVGKVSVKLSAINSIGKVFEIQTELLSLQS